MILPLYNTEIHYIVRADSELNYLHDIKNAKINGGLVGSGAAFITHTLYRMMFGGPMPEAQASYLANDEALVKLVTDKSVDVVVVAAGQPAPIYRQHEARGAEADQAPEVRPRITREQARAEDLYATRPSARRAIPASSRRTSRRSRWARSWSPTTTTCKHTVDYVHVRALAVRELPGLQAKGHPEVARGQPCAAGAEHRLDLLPRHGARAAQLHCRKPKRGRRSPRRLFSGGADPRPLQLIERGKRKSCFAAALRFRRSPVGIEALRGARARSRPQWVCATVLPGMFASSEAIHCARVLVAARSLDHPLVIGARHSR